jgi:hypothetical protein
MENSDNTNISQQSDTSLISDELPLIQEPPLPTPIATESTPPPNNYWIEMQFGAHTEDIQKF